ncbi:hypothetical protein MKX01_008390 [Papaver californicum]|nr:hypothetical protein MKX01_008390 [Papaver californicum]
MGTQIVEIPATIKFIWKIDNFNLYLNNKVYHYSDVFSAGGAKWKVKIYPMGCGEVFDHLSMYLCVWTRPVFQCAAFSFAITNQTNPANMKTIGAERQFISVIVQRGWGCPKFLPLCELHDSKNGYLVNDICEIRIEISRKISAEAEKLVKQEGKHLSQAKFQVFGHHFHMVLVFRRINHSWI